MSSAEQTSSTTDGQSATADVEGKVQHLEAKAEKKVDQLKAKAEQSVDKVKAEVGKAKQTVEEVGKEVSTAVDQRRCGPASNGTSQRSRPAYPIAMTSPTGSARPRSRSVARSPRSGQPRSCSAVAVPP